MEASASLSASLVTLAGLEPPAPATDPGLKLIPLVILRPAGGLLTAGLPLLGLASGAASDLRVNHPVQYLAQYFVAPIFRKLTSAGVS